MKFESVISLAIAVVLGVSHDTIVSSIWGYYAASEIAPLGWLIDLFGGGTVLFWVGLYTHDVILSLLFAAPFAAVLVLFRGLNNWPCACLAVFASLVTSYWGAEWSNLDFVWLAQQATWWAALAMQLLSLPIAFVAIRAIRRRAGGFHLPGAAQGRAAA